MLICEICDCDCATDENATGGFITICEGCLEDAQEHAKDCSEEALDEALAQQELEDFEQADEYFGCHDDHEPW